MRRKTQVIWRRRLDAALTVLMLVVAVLAVRGFVARQSDGVREVALPTGPVVVDGLLSRGDKDSTAAVIVFADFQCPYCARFAANEMPSLQKEVADTGRALVEFAHFPLELIHPLARASALAVECAQDEQEPERSWKLHDRLFELSGSGALRTRSDLDTAVASISDAGSSRAIMDCIATKREDSRISSQIALGQALGVNSTPTFIVGRRAGSSFFPTKRIRGVTTAAEILGELRKIAPRR